MEDQVGMIANTEAYKNDHHAQPPAGLSAEPPIQTGTREKDDSEERIMLNIKSSNKDIRIEDNHVL